MFEYIVPMVLAKGCSISTLLSQFTLIIENMLSYTMISVYDNLKLKWFIVSSGVAFRANEPWQEPYLYREYWRHRLPTPLPIQMNPSLYNDRFPIHFVAQLISQEGMAWHVESNKDRQNHCTLINNTLLKETIYSHHDIWINNCILQKGCLVNQSSQLLWKDEIHLLKDKRCSDWILKKKEKNLAISCLRHTLETKQREILQINRKTAK